MPTDPRLPDALDAFMTRLRADLDAHFAALSVNVLEHSQQSEESWRVLMDEQVSAERAAMESRLGEVRTELEQRFAAERRELESLFAAERSEIESRLADERIERQATLAALRAETRDERIETFTRLVRAVRRLDEATSLSAILEALAKGAVAEASRVAVLIVEPEILRSWGHFGFAAGQGPFDIPANQVKLLTAAVSRLETSIVSASDAEASPDLPSFMRPPSGHAGLVAPLTVGGEVVAILYAEGAERRSEQEEAAVWAEEVELLVRHAAARLVNVTSERTVAVLTRSV